MNQATCKIPVDLGPQSYDIHIGKGLCSNPGAWLPFDLKGRSVYVLTDENVSKPHGGTFIEAVKKAGVRKAAMLPVPAGEQAKSMEGLGHVLSWLLDQGVDRRSVLFALGGGVIGDLGGFAAAIVMRGIPFVQVPTTLLAQVDSSVGGKTGINMRQGKNLVGAFYQPACVICDTDMLKTLPEREIRAGYAEIVKYGLIDDPEFFMWLESRSHEVCELSHEPLVKAISTSCRKKAEIVKQDEKEKGVRALLNLGHTFGHALEAACGYDGRLLHGEAVSIGMALAFQLSARLGHCPEKDAARVISHLDRAGLPTRISMISPLPDISAEDMVNLMKHDKKASAGQLVFVLTRGIGKAYLDDSVSPDDVRAVIQQSMTKD